MLCDSGRRSHTSYTPIICGLCRHAYCHCLAGRSPLLCRARYKSITARWTHRNGKRKYNNKIILIVGRRRSENPPHTRYIMLLYIYVYVKKTASHMSVLFLQWKSIIPVHDIILWRTTSTSAAPQTPTSQRAEETCVWRHFTGALVYIPLHYNLQLTSLLNSFYYQVYYYKDHKFEYLEL